jgi:archaellum component FlaC
MKNKQRIENLEIQFEDSFAEVENRIIDIVKTLSEYESRLDKYNKTVNLLKELEVGRTKEVLEIKDRMIMIDNQLGYHKYRYHDVPKWEAESRAPSVLTYEEWVKRRMIGNKD